MVNGRQLAAPACIAIILTLSTMTAVAAMSNALSDYSFSEASLTQWKLPGKLREISGLVFHDGRLFGHNDQLGIVYELDYTGARLIKAFALGKKTVHSDFEGIAFAANHFYLINSDGRLFYAPEGKNGERVPYKTQATGLGKQCEIEGLAYDANDENLLIACKQARRNSLKKHVVIFKWSLRDNRLLSNETLAIKTAAIRRRLELKDFNPSGIEIDKKTGHLLIIAARQRAIVEIDRNGKLLEARIFPLRKRHRQAEGIALTSDGKLIIADEAAEKSTTGNLPAWSIVMTEKRKKIIFVHGHHVKPPEDALEKIWADALRWGLQRDFPDKCTDFDNVELKMAYFGDLSNEFLADRESYDSQLDIADRLHAFSELKSFNKRKKFNRVDYQRLPGKTAVKELLADMGSPVLSRLGLEKPAIARLAPELHEYWDVNSLYGSEVRNRVRAVINAALTEGNETIILAHCMGAVVTYDLLWEASQVSSEKKIGMLVTMGCPLGNTTIQKKLAGSSETGSNRYPSNVLAWRNLSAEDDYICHDNTIADDFKAMLKHRLISSIKDFRIYNMSVRYGKSNPHSSIGYLVHPRIAKILSDWL